jgi:hypothetical protein
MRNTYISLGVEGLVWGDIYELRIYADGGDIYAIHLYCWRGQYIQSTSISTEAAIYTKCVYLRVWGCNTHSLYFRGWAIR